MIGLLTIEIYPVNSAIHLSTTGAKVATILNVYSPSFKFPIDFFFDIFFQFVKLRRVFRKLNPIGGNEV